MLIQPNHPDPAQRGVEWEIPACINGMPTYRENLRMDDRWHQHQVEIIHAEAHNTVALRLGKGWHVEMVVYRKPTYRIKIRRNRYSSLRFPWRVCEYLDGVPVVVNDPDFGHTATQEQAMRLARLVISNGGSYWAQQTYARLAKSYEAGVEHPEPQEDPEPEGQVFNGHFEEPYILGTDHGFAEVLRTVRREDTRLDDQALLRHTMRGW